MLYEVITILSPHAPFSFIAKFPAQLAIEKRAVVTDVETVVKVDPSFYFIVPLGAQLERRNNFV